MRTFVLSLLGVLFLSAPVQGQTVAQVATGITENDQAMKVLASCYEEWLAGNDNEWDLDREVCVRSYWLMSQSYHTGSYQKQSGSTREGMIVTGIRYNRNSKFAAVLDRFTERIKSGEFVDDPYVERLMRKLPRTRTAESGGDDELGTVSGVAPLSTKTTWCVDSHGNPVRVSEEVCESTPGYEERSEVSR